jgi:heat-inducible transcriptional repressor
VTDAVELGRRERELLRAIVQDYIASGEPVASTPLLARHELEISPATVRHVMADLEALGYLEKPHTSAGRVPTERGYRLYVDTLVKMRPPSPSDRDRIDQVVQGTPGVEAMLGRTAEVLHALSHHAGVVTTPDPGADPLRRLEFVRLREDRCLAVFVTAAGIITNRVLQLDAPMPGPELERAGNYLNEKLTQVGGGATQLREALLAEMRQDQSAMHALVEKALVLAEQALASRGSGGVLVDGEVSLLEMREFTDIGKARALLKAFSEKDRMLRVLEKAMAAREVQIFIGAESEFAAQADVSVVVAPYAAGERVLGTLAVVGPTRMNYGRVIPLVDFTAKQISRMLDEGGKP